ncbi:MAG: hypothetical protein H7Y60_13255 [Rhodospirillaceae bacterium]|nr:hypothetical protein [Rhodospirillales bacterium]
MFKMIATTAFALALLGGPAAADPGGKHGNRHEGGERERSTESDLGSIIISAAERALIREYYQQHPVAVSGNLPHGIQKKLARGKPLPPGIAKKFPGELSSRMPPRPGYGYRTVGSDVLLVEVATGVIVDLIKDVLR